MTEVKPGYKTTEFWTMVVLGIVGMLLASGAIGEMTALGKALAFVAATFGGSTYAVVRGAEKKAASLVEAAREVSASEAGKSSRLMSMAKDIASK